MNTRMHCTIVNERIALALKLFDAQEEVSWKDIKTLAGMVNGKLSGQEAYVVVEKTVDMKVTLEIDECKCLFIPAVSSAEDVAVLSESISKLVSKHVKSEVVEVEQEEDDKERDSACVKVALYDECEEKYVEGVNSVLLDLNITREECVMYWCKERVEFHRFLQRPSSLEECVEELNESLNGPAQDMRFHPQCKAELFARIEEFAHRLIEEAQERKKEAEKEIDNVVSKGWEKFHKRRIGLHFLNLMRLELLRLRMLSRVLDVCVFKEGEDLNGYIVDKEDPEVSITQSFDALMKIKIVDETLENEFHHKVKQLVKQAQFYFTDAEDRRVAHVDKFSIWIKERIEAEYVVVERYAQFAKNKVESNKFITLP